MNDKELVRVAHMIQEALWKLRKGRYLECMRQLSLFVSRLHDLAHESRKLGLALSHDWLAASEHSCRSISRHLSEVSYAASNVESLLNRRHREVPNLSAITEELRALQQEFDEVTFKGQEVALCVVTEPITLHDIYLGPFQIALYPDKLGDLYQKNAYIVIAVEPHPAATDEAITHPHVSNEAVCEGDGAAAIRAALETGRLTDFFTMVRSILTTYNPDSPYVSLSDWYGIPCYDCGYVMDDESSYYCSYCENAVCDECSSVCATCMEIVCGSCVDKCEICERSLCPTCAKSKCRECSSVCCGSCLDDDLCVDCRNKENEDEDEEEGQETETNEDPDTKTPETTALARRLAG